MRCDAPVISGVKRWEEVNTLGLLWLWRTLSKLKGRHSFPFHSRGSPGELRASRLEGCVHLLERAHGVGEGSCGPAPVSPAPRPVPKNCLGREGGRVGSDHSPPGRWDPVSSWPDLPNSCVCCPRGTSGTLRAHTKGQPHGGPCLQGTLCSPAGRV